jgi:hypothetical protein
MSKTEEMKEQVWDLLTDILDDLWVGHYGWIHESSSDTDRAEQILRDRVNDYRERMKKILEEKNG